MKRPAKWISRPAGSAPSCVVWARVADRVDRNGAGLWGGGAALARVEGGGFIGVAFRMLAPAVQQALHARSLAVARPAVA